MSLLLVLAGAAIGAPLRFLTDRAVQARHDTVLPWGTFTVNVVGSLVLGLLAGVVSTRGASAGVQLALGTGFCGALSTYSTFSYETLRLLEDGSRIPAVSNVIGSIVGGLLAAAAGFALGSTIGP
jgi:fluoride exporter